MSVQFNDLYQFTMVHGYFLTGKTEQKAVFDCYFRKSPFKGDYAIAAGLNKVLDLLQNFKISKEFTKSLKTQVPTFSDSYLQYLTTLDCSQVEIHALREGQLALPCIPLLRISGPLAVIQLLQTPILNLIGFATLVTTYANRIVRAAGGSSCIQMGLRRAQGPDGGLSASQYSYMGGFIGSSNTKACHQFNVPCFGTTAHAFVTSFSSIKELGQIIVNGVDIKLRALHYHKSLGFKTNLGQLAAFVAFTKASQGSFKYINLLDTYSTLESGMPNLIVVSLALIQAGFTEFGGRLDSGDLCQLSIKCKEMWNKYVDKPVKFSIIASNDLDEQSILKMKQKGCQIDVFGVGTNLVTCKSQPSLGIVFKLVQLNGQPKMKISQQSSSKIMLAGSKSVYRAFNKEGKAVADIIALQGQDLKAITGTKTSLHDLSNKEVILQIQNLQALLQVCWKKGERVVKETLGERRERAAQRSRLSCQLGGVVLKSAGLEVVQREALQRIAFDQDP